MVILPARIKSRLYAVRHKTYVHTFSRVAPYYIVNEFPKSGGTWLAQMLADALDLPFRRNQPIRLERSVTHGHLLSPLGMHNVVVLWRDPRDILISFYYHCYFVNELHNGTLVQLMKVKCPFRDYTDIRANLPRFIRFLTKTPVSPRFSWPNFVRVWGNREGTVQTSYEALRADTVNELTRIITSLTGGGLAVKPIAEVVEKHSFSRVKIAAQERLNIETEVSFVREGSLGGWRKHFTYEAKIALRDCGYEAAMRGLGYEPTTLESSRE